MYSNKVGALLWGWERSLLTARTFSLNPKHGPRDGRSTRDLKREEVRESCRRVRTMNSALLPKPFHTWCIENTSRRHGEMSKAAEAPPDSAPLPESCRDQDLRSPPTQWRPTLAWGYTAQVPRVTSVSVRELTVRLICVISFPATVTAQMAGRRGGFKLTGLFPGKHASRREKQRSSG